MVLQAEFSGQVGAVAGGDGGRRVEAADPVGQSFVGCVAQRGRAHGGGVGGFLHRVGGLQGVEIGNQGLQSDGGVPVLSRVGFSGEGE